MTNNTRWRTSVHEAGHVIAAIALGGRCDSTSVYASGGGVANIRELGPDCEAYAVAAGPRSEFLADDFSPPALPEPSTLLPSILPPEFDETATLEESFAKLPKQPDAVRLARWAIENHETDPESWAGRVRFANHVASKIIDDQRHAIIQLARELYLRGELDAEEILGITSQDQEAEPCQC